MEILGLLFLIAIGFAAKSAWDHTWEGHRKSRDARAKEIGKKYPKGVSKSRKAALMRRHDAGWLAREVGHGLPHARDGWRVGWLAHKAASEHDQVAKAAAETEHLEAKATRHKAVGEHVKRQKAAQKAIDEAIAASPGDVRGKKAVDEVAGGAVADLDAKRAEKAEKAAGTGDAPPLPADGVAKPAEAAAARKPLDLVPDDATTPPKLPAGDPPPADAAKPAPIPATQPASAGTAPSPASTTGGTHMAASTDTNYTSVLNRAKARVSESDQDMATIKRRLTDATADLEGMQGADVDAKTLSAQMDLVDRLGSAHDAIAAVGEQAGVVSSTVQGGHGGIKAAVDDAPVARAAEREFYEGD